METIKQGNMPLPHEVRFVIDRLESAGYHAYAVGGCVRDHLMGRVPGDYDVTTSASPDEMLDVFSDCRVVETGLKHGTLTVVRGGMNIEATTYRIDGSYADGRHPDSVVFTDSLAEDLCRRDFTINAMAYHPERGIVDLHGGVEDLEKRVIRCVGRAEERFHEDGLRILRAMRFSSVLDFTPDEECTAAIHKLSHLLEKISAERIYSELTKLLCGTAAERILAEYADVVASLIDGLDADSVREAAGRIGLDRELHGETAAEIRYAILLDSLACGDTKKADRAMLSLKPSSAERTAVKKLLLYRDVTPPTDEYGVLRLIHFGGDEFPGKLASYWAATGRCSEEDEENIGAIHQKILTDDIPRTLSHLRVSGADLLEIGLRGRKIGDTLEELLDLVMRRELKNDKESLMGYVKRNG